MDTSIAVHTDHVVVGHLTKHAAERDDRSDAGEVEEDDRRQALQVQSVGDVASVVAIATSDVRQQTAEQPDQVNNQRTICTPPSTDSRSWRPSKRYGIILIDAL